ncbi:MAG: Ig-like domain-containing protein [Chloroflexi bacterium]|nr:Ig-like domain-containing protein [Chloroflexota bacterium]
MKKKINALLFATIIFALALSNCTGKGTPTPTEPLPVDVNTGQFGIHIVDQKPMEGQRLDLSPTIEFTFDRGMDAAKTEAAFSLLGADGEPVSGRVTWLDARRFSFQPTDELQASSSYTAAFGTDAADADGNTLSEAIVLEFKTVESLTVGQVFPAVDAEAVEMGTNVTVIFNKPIVPVTIEEEQDNLPQPLIFSPDVKGKGNWVNSSVYVFEPEENLLSGTRYTVRVEAGLKDMTGNALDDAFVWQFVTRQPSIGFVSLKNGIQNPPASIANVLLDQSFIVTFMQAMDQESAAEAVSLVNRETRKAFPLKLKWNEDSTELTIEPVGKYQIANFYELAVSDSAQATDGGRLKEGWTLDFSTVQLPAITQISPEPNSTQEDFSSYMCLTFASPMNAKSLNSRVVITPKPKNELSFYYNDYDWSLGIYGLEPSTNYVVRLLPGMADIYGNTIKTETSFSLTTAAMSPYARLALPWMPLVYRAKGPQEVFLEHVNLDWATVSLYPVTYDEFTRVLRGEPEAVWFNPSAQPLREWKVEAAELNELGRLNIKLEDRKGSPLAPGYYFIGVNGAPLKYDLNFYDGHMLIVATDNITFKATDREGLAWVTDLETGAPQANVDVTFYNEKYKKIGTAKTDKNGLAYLDNINRPVYVQVEGTDHLAFASLDWGSGVSAGDFGLYETYYSDTNRPFAYLYTDRPIYRPGQDVFFKGIVRNNDDLHYSLPLTKKVYVTVDHWGEQVYADYIELSETGSFTDKLTLDENAALGGYEIYVRYSPNGNTIGFLSFNVAEYHKPEFEVSAGTDQTDVLSGATVTFSMDTKYYSGGNVANANVDWFMQAAPFYFRPSEDYSQFSFSDWDRDSYWSEQQSTTRSTLDEGQTVTDANGHLELAQTVSLGETKTSKVVSFNANVTDVGGNLVSGSTSVIVHQSEVYAGIRSEKYIGVAGEAQAFQAAALDWDSEPVAGQTVSVKFVERRWYSVQEQDEQGQLRWVTSVEEIPAGTQSAVTDEKGLASVSFIPPNGGVFKALVTVNDSKGNSHSASTYIWVSSDDYISWKQTNDRTFNLVADKDDYSPGDTAEILIAQPFEGEVYALVTYERGHIYKQDVVLLKGTSTIYKLPITGDMAPMAYVSVTVISGAENSGKPNFKIGMTMLKVATSEQTLDVSVTTDKESAGPGDEVTYTIVTKDSHGKPVSADVSLAVVDKAVLALAPMNSASLLEAFYPDQSLGVRTAVGIVSNADDYNALYRESIPEGGGSGGGGGGELGIVTVRSDFKDTAGFEGMVSTDENGEAQVTVSLPENLTTWRADVRAVTADSKVGQTTNEVLSTKPLFVEMTTPRFFVVGDEVQVGAVVHNNTAAKLEVSVNLEAEGVALNNEASQSVEVEAKGQSYVTWNLTVDNVQRVDFTVHASGGRYKDSSKPALGTLEGQGIPVYNFTAVETVGTSGMLLEANSATEGLQLPASPGYTDANLSIEVSPSLAASMQSGLTYLEDFDYLCMEQTISRFLPNVITMRALEAAGLSDPRLKSHLDQQVNAALQRIYAKQIYDGGWNWWDGDKSDPYVTAYVVYGLLEAKDSGYPVAEGVLTTGLEYLKDHLPILSMGGNSGQTSLRGGGGGGYANWEYNRYVFMMYVLARGKQLGAGQTSYIYENREVLSLYAKAYLAQTLFLLDKEDKRITSVMSDLAAASVLSASGAHWEEGETDYWNWNTDTRTTAIVLNTFVQIDPKNPITANAVRWLMAHRDGGHWHSTQETAWTLIALTNWLVESKEFETSYQYAVGLNGESLEQGTASKDNLTETVKLQIELKDLLKDEVNYLVFARGEGTGNLYYTAYMNATLPVEEVQALDQGVSLSREYFTLDDSKHPITEIERGELVRVRLTVVVPAALHYIVIDDPLPAGFEAVDASLNTSVEVPLSYTREDYNERGWGWWYFYHKEFRDEKVVLSSDYLPAGTYVYTYLARASTAGTFKVIPPTASEFYFPDVGGRGAGSVFVVK